MRFAFGGRVRQQRPAAAAAVLLRRPMSGFVRDSGGRLLADGALLADIAADYGTPCYVYSAGTMADNIARLKKAFAKSKPRFFYAVKAGGNLSILKIMREAGLGFDIVSGGELARTAAAGGKAGDVVFSGVGKSADEIRAALAAGVGCFNMESAAEMERIESVAAAMKKKAPVAVRVTPDIDGDTHRHLTTGVRGGKFGMPPDESLALARRCAESAALDFRGFACHLGSQIQSAAAYVKAAQQMDSIRQQAQGEGIAAAHMDFGGGFAVDYQNGGGLNIELQEFDAELSRRFNDAEIWLEPGRSLTASAGVLLTRVEYIKHVGGAPFWIVDAGMNDFLRPAMYDAAHRIENIAPSDEPPQSGAVAGPICESADMLSRECSLSARQGDILAVRDAGAYGASMMSSYNARLRPCEVLADNGKTTLIRRRETLEDMLAAEKI